MGYSITTKLLICDTGTNNVMIVIKTHQMKWRWAGYIVAKLSW